MTRFFAMYLFILDVLLVFIEQCQLALIASRYLGNSSSLMGSILPKIIYKTRIFSMTIKFVFEPLILRNHYRALLLSIPLKINGETPETHKKAPVTFTDAFSILIKIIFQNEFQSQLTDC